MSEIPVFPNYYLSGPMAGYPEYNYPAFEAAKKELTILGIKIVSPHDNVLPDGFNELTEQQKWDAMMSQCVLKMQECKGIILLRGWAQSRGARQELNWAMGWDWPVYYFANGVILDMNKEVVL